jgi:hypothetical protein
MLKYFVYMVSLFIFFGCEKDKEKTVKSQTIQSKVERLPKPEKISKKDKRIVQKKNYRSNKPYYFKF